MNPKYEMTIKDEIMVLLANEGLTLTDLAMILTRTSGKKYTVKTLSQKLCRNTLRCNEFKLIADTLGYKIEIIKKEFKPNL